MLYKFVKAMAIGVVCIYLGGCATRGGMGACGKGGPDWVALIGTAAGGALGTYAGQKLGSNDLGKALGAAGGAVAGYYIGSAISAALDQCDQNIAQNATAQALNAPTQPGQITTTTWKSDHTDANGTVTTTNFTDPQGQGRQCKQTRHVVYVGGKEHLDTGVSCQNPNGGWNRV